MKTILIVEDELSISRVLKAYLEKANYQTIQAYDRHQAIEYFHSCYPSIVLLDVMLPDKDGWSVLQHIRKKISCPVIMLTALGQVTQKLKERLKMVKPFLDG